MSRSIGKSPLRSKKLTTSFKKKINYLKTAPSSPRHMARTSRWSLSAAAEQVEKRGHHQ